MTRLQTNITGEFHQNWTQTKWTGQRSILQALTISALLWRQSQKLPTVKKYEAEPKPEPQIIKSKRGFTVRKENDIYVDVPLTITEAVLGCKKEVPTLTGVVVIDIDAGSQSGDQLRLRGKGVKDPTRNKKGDMYVVLDVVIPNKLDRKQKELFKELSKTDLESGNSFKEFKKYFYLLLCYFLNNPFCRKILSAFLYCWRNLCFFGAFGFQFYGGSSESRGIINCI